MVLLRDRLSTDDEHEQPPGPDAGVIVDARSRQRRHRLGLAALFVAALVTAGLYVFTGGGAGGDRRPSGHISRGESPDVRGGSVRLAPGQRTYVITIKAPADHAYDVTMRAPRGAQLILDMNFGFPGSRFSTRDKQFCSMTARSTTCTIHLAAGGNAGGTWRWKLTKTSLPAARVVVRVVFASRPGDYPG